MTVDWTHPLAIAFAGSLLPSVLALLAYLKARSNQNTIRRVEVNLNGKLETLIDRIMELTGMEALSRGELKGAENERVRHAKQEDQ